MAINISNKFAYRYLSIIQTREQLYMAVQPPYRVRHRYCSIFIGSMKMSRDTANYVSLYVLHSV